MTKSPNSDRFPMIFAVVAFALLLAIGGYLWMRADGNAGTGLGSDRVKTASADADKALSAAGMNDNDRRATEAVVRAYILDNPEIITEAVEILQQRQVAGRLSASADSIAKPFYGAEAGNPNGDVTVVEFTDYNCGFCRSSVADVERLLASDSQIRLIYREVPILSQSSREAALWALAAAKQGKHKAFHAAMFAGDPADSSTIRKAATRAGMDIASAEKFAASAEAAREVDGNIEIMRQVGFSGTPTFIIGDQILEGALGFQALKAAVARARNRSS